MADPSPSGTSLRLRVLGALGALLAAALLSGCAGMRIGFTTGSRGIPLGPVRQDGPETCGSAALESVLRHWGVAADRNGLREKLGDPPRRGYHLNQLQAAAESYGLKTALFRGSREDLRRQTERGRPCLIVVHTGPVRNHCLVVTAVGPHGLEVLDPARGRIRFRKWETVEPAWNRLGSPLLLVLRSENA